MNVRRFWKIKRCL